MKHMSWKVVYIDELLHFLNNITCHQTGFQLLNSSLRQMFLSLLLKRAKKHLLDLWHQKDYQKNELSKQAFEIKQGFGV